MNSTRLKWVLIGWWRTETTQLLITFFKKAYSGFRNRYCYGTDIRALDFIEKNINDIDEGCFLFEF